MAETEPKEVNTNQEIDPEEFIDLGTTHSDDHAATIDPPSNWSWEGQHTKTMSNLLKTGFLSDATLILGSNSEKFRVHKLILQSASPVFYEKFRDNKSTELVIENVDPETFAILLQFVYTGNSEVDMKVALPVLKLATDFKVTGLADRCAEVLRGKLTTDTVIELFQQAKEYGRTELAKSTENYICQNAWVLVESKQFLKMNHDRLLDILSRDDLIVNSEIQLFEALVKWGEAECKRKDLDPSESSNVRKVLDKLIGLIRFPVMDAEEFTLNVALKNILRIEELFSVMLYFNVSKEKRALIPVGLFNSSKREARIRYDACGQQICDNCGLSKKIPRSFILRSFGELETSTNYGYCVC